MNWQFTPVRKSIDLRVFLLYGSLQIMHLKNVKYLDCKLRINQIKLQKIFVDKHWRYISIIRKN